MQSDYYINLHFNQAVAQKTGYAFKIGDKGCTFHFHCEDLDPSGMYPHIVFNHPNNTCVEGVPTGSGRDYAYTIAGNEFGVCGKTVVDLKFYDNNNDATQRISTASFMIEIIADTYTDFEESSSSYADSLERAREEIDAAILDLQGAEHDLEEAEGDLDDMSEEFANTLQDYIDAFGNTAPINPRGEYDPNEQYVPRDAVEYTAGGKTLTYINRSACIGIAPTDPDHGAEHWQIMIDVSVGGSFSALSDVSVDPQTLADGQVPVYDATGQVWENKTILEDSLTSTATDKALTAAKGKELQDNKQGKELETAITVAGTSKTTVEGALDGINAYVDDTVEAAFDVYGAKNQLKNNLLTTTGDVTYTINDDGSITVSGTPSSDSRVTMRGFTIPKGVYILSGIRGYSVQNMKWDSIVLFSNGTVAHLFNFGGGYGTQDDAIFDTSPYTYDEVAVILSRYQANVACSGTVYPMIRDARILDPTFVPFAKTNLQLTEDKAERADLSTIHATGSTNTTGAQINAGAFFYLNGVYCKAKTDIANGTTFTLNTNFEVTSVGNELNIIKAISIGSKTTDANGNVDFNSYIPTGYTLFAISDTTSTGTIVLGGRYGRFIGGSTSNVVAVTNTTIDGIVLYVRKN